MPEKGFLSKKLFDRLPLCERPLTWVAKRFQHRGIFNDFIQGDFGSEYGVTAKDRTRMVAAFKRNRYCIESLGFLDVDLVDSTRACLQYIGPRLVENGVIYSDDAGDLDVVRIFC